MKHKYIKNTVLAGLCMTMFCSCSSSWLDVYPSDGAGGEAILTDKQGAESLLTGVYDGLQGPSKSNDYYGARMIYFGDVRGDDMQSNGTGKRTSSSYEMKYDITSAPSIWFSPYRTIKRANEFIEAMEAAGNIMPEAEMKDMIGQVYVARALAHFDVLRVYSLAYKTEESYKGVKNGDNFGIPILTSKIDLLAELGRNTISECYTQIESDLNDALTKYTISDKKKAGFFNAWAAKGLLARVLMYKGNPSDYKKAYDLAVDVITNSPYQLWTNEAYEDVWKEQGTSEMLFEIVNESSSDWVDKDGLCYVYRQTGYADAVLTKKFVDFAETNYSGDVRLKLMEKSEKEEPAIFKGKNVFVAKYPGRTGADDQYVNNVPILRLSEIYLIAAETAFHLNDKKNAVKYLNDIVLRGNPTATKVTDATISLERILDENRIEFFGEGHRYFDLMRNKLPIVRYKKDNSDIGWHEQLFDDSREFSWDYFRALIPIPEKETFANRELAKQQNPGY